MDRKIYICDTNIFLSGLISKQSPPYQSVAYILQHGIIAFSQETFQELSEVLGREKFDKIIPLKYRKSFLVNLKDNCIFYEIESTVDICRDPKDNKFLDVAITSNADYLITGDEDLLVLERIEHTSIITPKDFIDSHQ